MIIGMDKINKPNFFIIGAPKCGTTSLAQWLSEHPQVYFSLVKEPFYFSEDIYQNFSSWDEYLKLFSFVKAHHLAIGEGTTHYLFSAAAVKEIERRINDPKYIVMVRNPVDMAYALHQQQVYGLNEDVLDFEQAWHLSPQRRKGERVLENCQSPLLLDYQEFCLLGKQVERLFDTVPRERVLLLKLDDFREDSRKEYLKVIHFLNLEDDGREDFPVYNQAKRWRNRWQGKIVRALSKFISILKFKHRILPEKSLGIINFLKKKTIVNDQRSPLSPDFRKELLYFFKEDIKLLSELMGEDLSGLWGFNEI